MPTNKPESNEPELPGHVASTEGLGGSASKRYVGGRIVGGCSLHAAHNPNLCQPYHHRCPEPRTVDCCDAVDEHDIVECSHCGKQWTVPCSFDEDYS